MSFVKIDICYKCARMCTSGYKWLCDIIIRWFSFVFFRALISLLIWILLTCDICVPIWKLLLHPHRTRPSNAIQLSISRDIKVCSDRQPISKQPFEINISAHTIATSHMHREKSIKHRYDNVLTCWRPWWSLPYINRIDLEQLIYF